jgi:hypothetical protein
MNKRFEYLFFNVYNWYYKMKLSGRNVDPGMLTVSAFAICCSMWGLVIYAFCDRLFIHHYLGQKILAPIVIIVWVISYYLFSNALLDNYKYLDIYNKYKEYAATNAKAKRDTLLSILFLVLPVIVMVIYAWI